MALTLTPMMCSLLLRHETKHSWIYNKIEAGFEAFTNGYRAPADGARCTHAGSWSSGWVATLGVGGVAVHDAQVGALADRGPRRHLRPRDRAAGLDAAVHRRPAAARSRSSTARFRRRSRYTAISGFPTVVDGNAVAAPQALGGAHQASSRRSPTSCARSSRRSRACWPFPLNPPSLGQSFRSTPIEYVIMSQVPYAELQRMVDRFLDEARKIPGRAEPADRPAPQHAGGARQHQPRQARRRRRQRRHRRPHAGDDARRPPGDALQARRRAVRRDRAGGAGRPHVAGGHQRHLRARPRRRDGAARQPRRRARKAWRRSRSTTSSGCARSRSPARSRPATRSTRR